MHYLKPGIVLFKSRSSQLELTMACLNQQTDIRQSARSRGIIRHDRNIFNKCYHTKRSALSHFFYAHYFTYHSLLWFQYRRLQVPYWTNKVYGYRDESKSSVDVSFLRYHHPWHFSCTSIASHQSWSL